MQFFDFQPFFQNLCPSNLIYTYNVIFNPYLSRIYYLGYFAPNYWGHDNQKETYFTDQTIKRSKLKKICPNSNNATQKDNEML